MMSIKPAFLRNFYMRADGAFSYMFFIPNNVHLVHFHLVHEAW